MLFDGFFIYGYREYPNHVLDLMSEAPWVLLIYVVVALVASGTIVYLLGRRPPSFLRTFSQTVAVAVFVLPGIAVAGHGAMALPLVVALVVSLVMTGPYFLLYNFSFLLAALAAAFVIAIPIHRFLVKSAVLAA